MHSTTATLSRTHRHPIEGNMFTFDDEHERYTQFDGCEELATVHLVGGDPQNYFLFESAELEK